MVNLSPQPGPQWQFSATSADICIYGGAAGGGKTFALLLEPTRHYKVPGFRASIFRNTFTQITMQGGMWDISQEIYPHLGAKSNESKYSWSFPSGAKVSFSYLNREADKIKYLGAQITFLGFDQLEQFSEGSFFYLIGRTRSMSNVTPYVRATCNPDPDSWLRDFLDWWLDEETGLPIPERAGVLRWFVRINDKIIWSDDPKELQEKYGGDNEQYKLLPKSMTFIPAFLSDNRILTDNDPTYFSSLMTLPYIEQQQLLHGNWNIRPEAGKVFNRAWFTVTPSIPSGGRWCRFWDFAAKTKQMAGDDPDYTAGVLVSENNGIFTVIDSFTIRAAPAQIERTLLNITLQDIELSNRLGASSYQVRWEFEPGSASYRDTRRLVMWLGGNGTGYPEDLDVRRLANMDVAGVPTGGKDKLTRARGVSSQAYAGNVQIVEGKWNSDWLSELHDFPDAKHDDQVDATSGAYNTLAGKPHRKIRKHTSGSAGISR